MTVLAAEVKWYKSATVSDAAGNGGRMSAVQSVSSVAQNVFPDVPQSERTAGSTKYRKLFVKVASAANEALQNSRLYLHRYTPGDDLIQFFLGTQTDTQGDISGPTLYGTGKLNATVLAGVTSIDVLVENWSAGTIFRNGDTIRITDKTTPGGAGNEEIHVINGAPGVSGNIITLTLTTALANGYNSASTYIGSGLSLGSIVGSFDTWVETTGAGTYAEATPGNVVVDSVGGIEQNWTITFTSATAFNVSGNTVGALASGVIGSNYAPNNPDFSEPYFTILSAGWGGTWATNDTITFTTHPAAKGVWFKRVVPAGAGALASNFVDQVVIGESV
jgi:hypothetical protein